MRVGDQTFIFDKPIYIIGASAVVGPKEIQGNLGSYFDIMEEDDTFGQKSFEKAEAQMHKSAILRAASATGGFETIDAILSGDISNQITASSYSARGQDAMFLGLYSACATFGQAVLLGSMLIGGGYMKKVMCSSSSHFASAERQYRFPLELGGQRPPMAQWTVTGAGAIVLSNSGEGPKVTGGTLGKIVDLGISDTNNMGAAMAPAACECMYAHFNESGRGPDYYDLILTGDLGKLGLKLVRTLLKEKGIDMPKSFNDCGAMIYKKTQSTHMGGSGAGCVSSVFAAYVYKELRQGTLKKVLIVPTGALLSKTSSEQGETIPGIAHAVSIEVS